MQLLFITDPLDALKAYKDTTVTMMREAHRRGHAVHVCEQATLASNGGTVQAAATRISVAASDEVWYTRHETEMRRLASFDAVVMRKDPPFDMEFVTSTWLLSAAEREGARIVNSPAALRDHNEKLAILEFPDLIPPTLVTRDAAQLQAFVDTHRDTILKPLDGMGGTGIFRVRADDPNRNVIVELTSANGSRSVMAQGYIPAISAGDKRVLLIGGQAAPYSLARIPKPGETRGNLAAGGRGVAQPLSAADRRIADRLGPLLLARGLLLVGLDVIGEYLTEVNVTSPTCFREIMDQTGCDVAALFVDALESAVRVAANDGARAS